MTAPGGSAVPDTASDPGEVPPPRTIDTLSVRVNNFTALPPGVFTASDSGNAKRLAHLYGDVVRYAEDSKAWYVWNGSRWQPDVGDIRVLSLTLGVANYIRHVELDITPGDPAPLERFATATESERSRRRMLTLAAADPALRIREADTDADPWLLVTRGGTLDLRTGELRENRPGDLNTQLAHVTPDPAATCPRFDSLLAYAFPDDPALVAYLWRVLGYCLTGLADEQEFYFLWGERFSAKSTICEVLVRLLGTYAKTLDENALTGSGRDHPTWIADLLGKRVVYQDELDARQRLNTGRINRLTGSSLPLRGRRMRQDFFDVPVRCKLLITTNHRPPLGNAQDGIWRRLRPVRFGRPWPEEQRIKDFSRVMADEEGAGILNRCLAGLRDYLGEDGQRRLGLKTPDAVILGAREYQDSEDDTTPFLEDHLVRTGDHERDWLGNDDIFTAYEKWCETNLIPKAQRMTGTQLGRYLSEQRFTATKMRRVHRRVVGGVEKKTMRGWSGVRLGSETSAWAAASLWTPVTTPLPGQAPEPTQGAGPGAAGG